MFERPHHQILDEILSVMDASFLREAKCYFGGGTAISLLLGEYRESVDLDFLCADQNGYRLLRSSVFDHGLAELFPGGIPTLREIRADRDGIRTVLLAPGQVPVKFEIVREARVPLVGEEVPGIPVPCLSREDMFVEKLLANADRYADKAVMSRDVIDLMVMEKNWGPVPGPAWDKATAVYGNSVSASFQKAKDLLRGNPDYLADCLKKMDVTNAAAHDIEVFLGLKDGNPTLAEQWNAAVAVTKNTGAIRDFSDTEVIQEAGQGRYVVWDRLKLRSANLALGKKVTIFPDGRVKEVSRDRGLGV